MLQIKGIPALQRRLKAVEKAASDDMLKRIQTQAVRYAKKDVPRKTGRLGASIRPGYLTRSYAIVKAGAGYAAHVELGTRPHTIRPRNAKILRFAAKGTPTRLTGSVTRAAARAGGAYVFAREVHHPGTKPQPYLVPGAKRAISEEVGREPIITAWNGAA